MNPDCVSKYCSVLIEPGFLGEMADSRAGARKVQRKPRTSYVSEHKKVLGNDGDRSQKTKE